MSEEPDPVAVQSGEILPSYVAVPLGPEGGDRG